MEDGAPGEWRARHQPEVVLLNIYNVNSWQLALAATVACRVVQVVLYCLLIATCLHWCLHLRLSAYCMYGPRVSDD
jgi:hypothetical protein